MSVAQELQERPAVIGEDTSFQIGRYEIRSEIGRGTMGIVYEAYDPSLRRTIALKTFHLSFAVSPRQFKSFEERFFAEARIAARLSHPGIVAVHDVGCDAELGTLYIALEYLQGRTLHEVIQDKVPLGWREALHITSRVAEALHYAHSEHVIHRDIKPANIMHLPSGDPKILDFGIARLQTSLGVTTCQVLGTPLFMAPEQALGEKSDGRADLFSLGSIAYTLLTGRLAFEGASIPATVRRLLTENPEPPSQVVPDLPRGVDEFIARALAKSPEHRYSCGQALVEGIEELLDGPRALRGRGVSADLVVAPAPAKSAPAGLDLDAELAALVSSPAAPADSVPAARLRRPHRRLLLVIALAVLSVASLSLIGPSPAAQQPVRPTPDSPASLPPASLPPASPPAVSPPAASPPAASPPPASPPPVSPPRARRGPTLRAEPERLVLAAANGPGTKPVGEAARLRISLEHPLGSGSLRLWIDGVMVLQQELEGRHSTKVPGLRLPKGRLDRLIAIEPGRHTVRVQVRWDDNDRDANLSGSFAPGAVRQLEVNLGRLRKNLSMKWL